MINKYENTHIEINIERAVFKYNYKITTRTPFMFAYLNLYSTYKRKQYFYISWSAKTNLADVITYQNKHLTITTFHQTSLFLELF